ncbi:hypothetical protein [Chitinophaga sp. S165]|uniref:hypothetical protein n=1 Tax=Chitinophaga sp. S165 TaxID=2135462 RepID=UPI000D712845|nr:hypothetical protein [Chitinophaga sp. S165]PWV56345.1 hypothetical protein C7475_101860 [Chitinophaga sp. S165]
MARQNSLFPFTGKLGNIIGYRRNGKYFLRGVPEVVRQTPATRSAAYRFGVASRLGALIRHTFYNDLDIACDSGHINRLNKALVTAAGNITTIKGFRFNQHTGIDRFFTIAPRLFRNEVLHIPTQSLSQYKGVTALEVKIIASRIDFQSGQASGKQTAVITIDSRMPFRGTNIPLDVPGEGTLVITLQVRGMDHDLPSSNRQYLAADIIVVATPQMPKVYNKHTYARRSVSGLKMPLTLTLSHSCQDTVQRE